MLDGNPAYLQDIGTVTITATGIEVTGFSAEDGGCREVAVLAAVWALGRLQDELRRTLERVGDNNICIG